MAQSEYSKIEQKPEVDEVLLKMIADVLEVSPGIIKNFSDDCVIFNIENMNDSSSNYQYNNKLDEGMARHYEKLLSDKDELLKQKDELMKQKDEIIEMYRAQLKAS